jgi:DNA topoisomerase IB
MSKSVSRKVKQLSSAITSSLKASPSPPGLVYVEEHDDLPGFTRKSSGKNFVYLDVDGTAIRDEGIVSRIKALAIPPAWSKVWICPVVNSHLQATGWDAKGRRQYLYHPEWRTQRDAAKFENLLEFGRELPRLRRVVNRDLRQRPLSKTRVVATIVRLGPSGVTEQKRRLSVVRSRIMQRPQLASGDGFRNCERIASQQIDMVVDQRR